jgi:hypothetical protein
MTKVPYSSRLRDYSVAAAAETTTDNAFVGCSFLHSFFRFAPVRDRPHHRETGQIAFKVQKWYPSSTLASNAVQEVKGLSTDGLSER